MRTKINLATQPYEDTRLLTTMWGTAIGVLFVSAILLSILVYHRWHEYRQVSHAITIERNVLADLDRKQAEDLSILNQPANEDVRDRSDFLNQLIRRKEVSWTRIFINLEKMMPPHLRVLSVQPAVVKDQIIVNMQLGGDSRDRAAELVRRMEKSKTFRNAQVVSESDSQATGNPQQRQDRMHFAVRAEYIPGLDEPVGAPTDNAAGGGK